jgi:hypothetical protein
LSNEEVDEQAWGESTKSEALQIFEKNLDNINRLVGLMASQQRPVFVPVHDAVEKLKELKGKFTTLTDSGLSSQMIDRQSAFEKVTNFVELMTFLNDWMLVMLVSFTEAYLEDVLTLLVGRNPGWLDDLKLKVSYVELVGASSRPEHLETMQCRRRERWVSNILRDKPQQWIRPLERLGANGYRASLAEEITTVWERRHDIVHSGATQHMSPREFQKALHVIDDFLKPTDHFVVNFLHSHPLP